MGHGLRLTRVVAIVTCVLLVASPLRASGRGGGDLGAALAALVAERNVPLLFDRRLVSGLKAGSYRADGPPEQALTDLLKGTGLVAVRLRSGAYVIRKASPVTEPPQRAAAAPLVAIPEILVVGHDAGNVDLPRSEDDIQPYHVLLSAGIDASLAKTTGELLSEQVTLNVPSPIEFNSFQSFSFGSYANFSGLGDDQTSVTVDGRHLPGIPGTVNFPQTDIGALSPEAIDRVETLGLTAGSIFGVGATGGALNVVLKHDYRGFEFGMLNGVSQRGDDAQHELNAKAGFVSADGRTKAMIRVGYNRSGGVLLGSRSVGEQQLALHQQLYPDGYVVGDAILIQSGDGSPLTLLPQYGGRALNATSTWLPLGAPGLADGGAALLAANAGKPLTSLAPDGNGNLQSLLPSTKALSLTASVRQDVGDRIELFADALVLHDSQRRATPGQPSGQELLFPGQQGNPFAQYIDLTFPTPGLVGRDIEHHKLDRETLGAIVRLWRGWNANIDFSTGEAVWTAKTYDLGYQLGDIDLFSGGEAIKAQLAQASIQPDTFLYGHDRMYDANARIAGPLMELPGGRATLTVTGEWRQDRNPGLLSDFFESDGSVFPYHAQAQHETISSEFAETRLPIFSSMGGFALTRGLTLQLAGRHDSYTIRIPGNADGASSVNRDAVSSYTIGASIEPLAGLKLRSSFAVGYEPPKPEQTEGTALDTSLSFICDPKRGGCDSPEDGDLRLIYGGSSKVKAQQVQTLSFGLILRPATVPGLRISIDYDRLLISHMLTSFAESDFDYFIDHEAEFPGRVIRAPLSAEDAALGYTAGKIEQIDASILDVGRVRVQAVEGAFDYQHSLGGGLFKLFGRVVWEPSFKEKADPDLGFVNLAGLLSGPLRLRANAGAIWTKGPWTLDANVRVFGAYRTAYYDETGQLTILAGTASQLVLTPSEHISAKAYLDLSIAYIFPVRLGELEMPIEYRFAVRNLMDVAPSPLVTDQVGYGAADPYSDFVGRRFELSLSAKF